MNNWKLEKIWNETIAQDQRELTARNHIWAGEIGRGFWERYQKMKGVKYTNPYDERTLRKFSAGVWFEQQIGFILKRIGILKSSQEYLEIPEDDKHLRITGKLDYIAGGITKWDEARQRVADEDFPDFVRSVSHNLIDYFEKEYPGGLSEIVYEIKSVNSQVFWSKKDYLEEAYPHHTMQLYTYLKAKNNPKGKILYISKDDLTIKEIEMKYPDEKLERIWQKDIVEFTNLWREQKEPAKPDSIVFDKRKKLRFQKNKVKHIVVGCYVPNWEVEWSPYFKLITGFDDKDKWSYSLKPQIKEKNEKIKMDYLANEQGRI